MLILNATTDSVQVVLNGAHTSAALNCVAFWRDLTASAYSPGRTLQNTNGATPVDAVPAPGASTQRVVDYLSVFNSDTGAKTVTVRLNLNGTTGILYQSVLGVGERLEYVDGAGFVTYNSAGAIKQTVTSTNNPVASGDTVNVLGSDVTNSNGVANTIADVTGLSFSVVSGNRYWFDFFIRYTAAATTTGSRWAINGPTNSELCYDSDYSLTATTRTLNTGQSAYDLPAASNASSATTGANIARITGIIVPTADGTVIARFASEVLSSAIVAKAGSFVRSRIL
jgi:hypothetical protein